MMNLQDRISAFAALGTAIGNFRENELEFIYRNASAHNAWFTEENIKTALAGVQHYLQKENLEKWAKQYHFEENPKVVGLVLAGNIPLVGFHDFLCVLIAGHRANIKLSRQDPFLLPYLVNILMEIAPDFKASIKFSDRLTDIEAIIATGSDNSSRYFKYYFSKYPHIIRQNRTSVAILSGEETQEDLYALGKDIFQYFGLGCRNISKLFLPKGYDFTFFFEAIQPFEAIRENHKYANNYDYNKSIFLINKTPHQDNGFLLTTPSQDLVSPISTLYFEPYQSKEQVQHLIQEISQKLQCIVSKEGAFPESIPFGKAQAPELEDYADNVDTLRFLEGIGRKTEARSGKHEV